MRICDTIKICVTNPHTTYARLLLARILSGKVYGAEQEVSVVLLSKWELVQEMEGLKVQLENCAFSLNAGIEVVHDTKEAIKDVHVFILLSAKEALCTLLCIETDDLPASSFDAILDVKAYASAFADKLRAPDAAGDAAVELWRIPLVVTDCLAALTVFAHYAANHPPKKLFCSTSLPTIARFILTSHLDVLTSQLSHLHVWAADNEALHIEADEPLINFEDDDDKCAPTLVENEFLESKNMDRTNFNESWMKNQLLEKTRARAAKDPFGPISSAHTLAALLKDISSLILYGNKHPDDPDYMCKERDKVPQITKVNAGVLSDGSYDIPIGLPFVFPIIITDGTWEVDQKYRYSLFVKKIMQQLKVAAKKNYDKIIMLCDKQRQDALSFVGSDGSRAGPYGTAPAPSSNEEYAASTLSTSSNLTSSNVSSRED